MFCTCQGQMWEIANSQFGIPRQGLKPAEKIPMDQNCLERWQPTKSSITNSRSVEILRKKLGPASSDSFCSGRQTTFLSEFEWCCSVLTFKSQCCSGTELGNPCLNVWICYIWYSIFNLLLKLISFPVIRLLSLSPLQMLNILVGIYIPWSMQSLLFQVECSRWPIIQSIWYLLLQWAKAYWCFILFCIYDNKRYFEEDDNHPGQSFDSALKGGYYNFSLVLLWPLGHKKVGWILKKVDVQT